jgi:putative oxidoreductase
VGFFSRLAALGIIATMAGAVFSVHLQHGLFMNWYGDKKGHGIEYHLLAIALAFLILVEGAGAWSLDRVLYQRLRNADTTTTQVLWR